MNKNNFPCTKTIIDFVRNFAGEEDLIFQSGSIIDGNGNNKSDIDVYIFSNDLSQYSGTYTTSQQLTFFKKMDLYDLDIEVWNINLVHRIINQINSINLNDLTIRTRNALTISGIEPPETLSLIHRMITGVTTQSNTQFQFLKKRLCLDAYYELGHRWYMNEVDNALDDITGELESGNFKSAIILLYQQLGYALTGFLLSQHITIDRIKWSYKTLQRNRSINKQLANISTELIALLKSQNIINDEDFANNYLSLINKLLEF